MDDVPQEAIDEWVKHANVAEHAQMFRAVELWQAVRAITQVAVVLS